MYFRVNLKMKKSTLCCFAWIVFIELNFTVAFLLIRKIWDYQFSSKVGGWVNENLGLPVYQSGGGMGDLKKWGGGILVIGDLNYFFAVGSF